MKLISLLIFVALFLVSCQTKTTDSSNLGSSEIKGTVATQNKSPVHLVEGSYDSDSDSTTITSKFDNLQVSPNEKLTIKFDRQPTNVEVYLIKVDQTKSALRLKNSTLTVPEEKGYYIYQLDAHWKDSINSYVFDVDVQ